MAKNMLILGIESSCDETSAAIIEAQGTDLKILSNVIASQIDIHKLYGGVVPEIAGRAHAEAISNVTSDAFALAGCNVKDIDVIGVTNRPGLIGALLVGLNFAKGLSYANDIPLVGVQHICGHICANYFSDIAPRPPFIALVASGGHTSLILVEDYHKFITLGRTRDDAIGEAFDKVARCMGIPYPGGKEMDRLASLGDKKFIKFPSAAIDGDNYDFSFSGLKTSVINRLHNYEQKCEDVPKEDIAASFTDTVVSSVIKKVDAVISNTSIKTFVIAGGVAANSHLRNALSEFCKKRNINFFMPKVDLCGDNGAMIAAQAYFDYRAGIKADLTLNAYATHDL